MPTTFSRALFLGASITTLVASVASAQSVDPGLIEKRFELPPVPRATTEPVAPIPAVQAPQVSPELQAVSFLLSDVQFSGVTAYADEELKQGFSDLLGQTVTLAQVQQAVNEVTRKYRRNGYVLSRAVLPQQEVGNGVILVQVLEGYVANVIVEGDLSERPLVQKYLRKIEGIRPLRVEDLERYVLLANDLPGVSAKAVLRPSQDALGGADVVVNVERDRFEGSVGLDNRGSKFLGRYQSTVTLTGNDMLGMYDRTSYRNVTTAFQPEELQYHELSHEQQLGNDGTRLVLRATRADSEPGSVLKPLNIEGESMSFEGQVAHPFIRSRAKNLTGRVSAEYRTSKTDLAGFDLTEDRVRSVRVGAEYDVADSFSGINFMDVELSQGIEVFNATEAGLGRSRADGEHDYTKVTGLVSRRQSLPLNLSWLTSAMGQYAFSPVLAPEEFTIGGLGFGQAYDPAELSGDHGAAIHTELQYGNYVGHRYFDSYQVYAYYDIGRVWQEQSSLTPSSHTSLASTGLGIRYNFTDRLSGSTEVALPLTKDLSANGSDDPRIFFNVVGRF